MVLKHGFVSGAMLLTLFCDEIPCNKDKVILEHQILF